MNDEEFVARPQQLFSSSSIEDTAFSFEENERRAKRIHEFRVAFMNERHAPELLPYETDLVDELKNWIEDQQDLMMNRQVLESDDIYRSSLRLEIFRLRFMLSSYLRCRLKKIERHFLFYLMNADQRARLSTQEDEFAVQFSEAWEKVMQSSFCDQLPDMFAALNQRNRDANMVVEPDYSVSTVFFRPNQDLQNIRIGESVACVASL